MQEVWKPIQGYEDYYKISNTGKVLSLRHGKIMKQTPNSSGYMRVRLSDGNGSRAHFVHRLVAVAFVCNQNPEINTVVNHIDSNYLNNSAGNLEWTTMKGNSQHALKSGRMNRTQQWLERLHETQAETQYRPVEAYDKQTGEVIYRFDAIQHVKSHGHEPSSVCECCKGHRQTHHGMGWRYAKR